MGESSNIDRVVVLVVVDQILDRGERKYFAPPGGYIDRVVVSSVVVDVSHDVPAPSSRAWSTCGLFPRAEAAPSPAGGALEVSGAKTNTSGE